MTKEEEDVRLAEVAKDLTIALWQDRNHGLLGSLRHDGKIPKGAHPMADFEEVLAELRRITKGER